MRSEDSRYRSGRGTTDLALRWKAVERWQHALGPLLATPGPLEPRAGLFQTSSQGLRCGNGFAFGQVLRQVRCCQKRFHTFREGLGWPTGRDLTSRGQLVPAFEDRCFSGRSRITLSSWKDAFLWPQVRSHAGGMHMHAAAYSESPGTFSWSWTLPGGTDHSGPNSS